MDHGSKLKAALLLALGFAPSACGGDTEGSGWRPPCTAPATDAMSGLVRCAEGYSHRPQPSVCVVTGAASSDTSKPVADGSVNCQLEASDCDAFLLGWCDPYRMQTCRSGCRTDADCGSAQICVCEDGPTPHGGECVPSDCKTDADCDGGRCASSADVCGAPQFACQAPTDECVSDSDCEGVEHCYSSATASRRRCSGDFICGRPFIVEGEPRLAPSVAETAWSARVAPRVDRLTTSDRAALAAHWTKLGRMEHASIAAFARFQLQLLALGAPPELVQACNQALSDETAHTQLCFGLASAYAGRALGPGPLDVAHSLSDTSLADVVDLVIAEGCIGETGAALEALEAADAATDPVIRDAYARIAEDEQRHAALAFRFVQWALRRGDPHVTTRVERAVAELPDRPFRDVVRPCLRAVLASRPS
jgi:hypothetical protein